MLNDPDECLLCNLVTVFYVWISILSVSGVDVLLFHDYAFCLL